MSAGRWAAAGLLVLLAGCAVPTGGAARAIPASEVPYGLASAAPDPAPSTASDPTVGPGEVYLVDASDALVPRPREVAGATAQERLDVLLDELAAGPTADERDRQLSTALPPKVELSAVELTDGTATVDIAVATDAPAGEASRPAVAQVVLTATSVPGVVAVVLTLDGERVEAPLPSGALTAEPLTRADYAAGPPPAPPS
ncbi:Spore germination protein GerM [Geodermatophilus pulveris]|uniref:Spore germination protein GerM n=1 Tax=Geodermatophilus pulveris TaxID=1564159 RepID=A0A239JB83_9ACTN|nr:GerMN domain-containing protein [Geodermatophilus pulveris]SNT03100.1 Spore germination protein GerM [Geodermatophilus pulveris]